MRILIPIGRPGLTFTESAIESLPDYVSLLLRSCGPVYCLGTTKSGAPRHPLYLPKDTELEEWA